MLMTVLDTADRNTPVSQTCYHGWWWPDISESSLRFPPLCPFLLSLQKAQLLRCAAWSGRVALRRFLRRQTFWCWWGQRRQPAPHTWPPQGQQVRSFDNPVRIAAWCSYVCPRLKPEKLPACLCACVFSCWVFLLLRMAAWFATWWLTRLFPGFDWADGKHAACCIWQRAPYLIFMLVQGAFMWMFWCVHAYARIIHIHIVVCRCVHTGMSVQFVPEGVKRPTPAGDLQRASLSSGEARTENEGEEMKQRTEGSLSPPPDIVISSFSHHIEEEGNNTPHTRSLGALAESSTVSSFSEQKKEEKKSKRREARKRRDRVKDIDSRGDKAPYPQRLYSSLLLYYF